MELSNPNSICLEAKYVTQTLKALKVHVIYRDKMLIKLKIARAKQSNFNDLLWKIGQSDCAKFGNVTNDIW